jgi:hypothetical protein
MQNYSSKYTSVNTKQLPAVYSKINWNKLPKHMLSILDWGCGRDTTYLKEWLEVYQKVPHYIRYDPNWCTEEENNYALECLGFANIFVCSNVLNVIDDESIIRDICDKASKHSIYFITVYEGNKSGVGKQSKTDCFQRNEKTENYFRFFPSSQLCGPLSLVKSRLLGPLTLKKGVLTNRPDLIK